VENAVAKYKSENELQKAGSDIVSAVEEIKITSQEKYLAMVELGKQAKAGKNFVKEFFEDQRLSTYNAYQIVLTKIRDYSGPWEKAEKLAKQRCVGWLEIERKRQAEKLAKQQEKIEAAKEEGREIAPKPAPVNRAKQAEGISYRENYEVTLTDWDKLIKAVASGKVPRNFVEVNLGNIKRFANSTKGQMEIPGVKIERKDIPAI
jgi:hypothetical protein